MPIHHPMLSENPFKNLDLETRNEVSSMFQANHFPQNFQIQKQSEIIRHIGYIVSGEADIISKSVDSLSVKTGTLKAGDYFGITSLLYDGISTIDLICTEPIASYTIPKSCLLSLSGENLQVRSFFEKKALKRISDIYFKINRSGFLRSDNGEEGFSRLHKSLEYINSFYMNSMTLDEVASINGLSKFHYSRIFHESMGCSFKTYLNRIRVKAAKQLMGQKQMNLTQICFTVGFNNVSYFSSVFKKLEGMSPSRYRDLTSSKDKYRAA